MLEPEVLPQSSTYKSFLKYFPCWETILLYLINSGDPKFEHSGGTFTIGYEMLME